MTTPFYHGRGHQEAQARVHPTGVHRTPDLDNDVVSYTLVTYPVLSVNKLSILTLVGRLIKCSKLTLYQHKIGFSLILDCYQFTFDYISIETIEDKGCCRL